MKTNFDLDRLAKGCEIVIPIVVKIPFYIEPVVLEQPLNCDVSQLPKDDGSASVVLPETAEATVSEATLKQFQTEKQPLTQLNLRPIKPGWLRWLQSLLTYFFPEDWDRIRRPVS